MTNFGEKFLHQKDTELHLSDPAMHEQDRKKRRGEQTTQKPAEKLSDWMKVLERTHLGHRDDPKVMERLKQYYYRRYVTLTLDDIPQGYWNNQAEIMIRQGYGGDLEQNGVEKRVIRDESDEQIVNYIFPVEMREQSLVVVRNNQAKSLETWFNYLTSDDAQYPMWAKYWAFTSMLKMGKLVKKEDINGSVKAQFQRRTGSTTNTFPLLNSRALAKTIGVMIGYLEEKERVAREKQKPKEQREEELLKLQIKNDSKKLKENEFIKLLSKENFAKLYAQFLLEIPEYATEGLEEIKGEWKIFPQKSKPDELVKSLEGYPLEWCTADIETARKQLAGGDFYVYYSYNEDGEAVIPRIAIRMEGKEKIAEVRGIATDQNLDPYIGPVVEKKMDEFGKEGDEYKQKTADMEQLTDVWERNRQGQELAKSDLRFLYEFDGKIKGFGYEADPRLEEIKSNRKDIRADLVVVTGFPKDKISLTNEEAVSGEIKFHYGNLSLSGLTTAEGLKLPENIGRDIDLSGLTTAEGLKLPKIIGGNLDLSGLTTAEGLNLPESIGGKLYLSGLETAEGLKLPESIGGNLYLSGLTTAKGLELPKSIGGSLALRGLKTADGLKLPESIGGLLNLSGLTTAKGLIMPECIGGNLELQDLTTAEGLKLPEIIGGSLSLMKLTTAKGLNLPENIGRDLDLSGLTTAKGLKLPENIGRDLELSGLTTAEGLKLPESIGGKLYLSGLTTAEGLKLPESIGSDLFLNGLMTVEGLKLPESIGGDFVLSGLTTAEGLKLPESIGGDLVLSGLTTADGLKLPENIGGDIDLSGLKTAEGLKLPVAFQGKIYCKNLSIKQREDLSKNYPNAKII
ncbi:hypothetical protein A2223_02755 [Candidatus Falkowbacteria bacterium RIFOXYA2_FULL_35_8]|uniref:Uncharacterized protein n=1 Tax=Candidatus Falkowbacteria bacterium RIFOXYC2_FULL_36_12 TaxID=1798002 RepID=A0A1F5SX09_9BACT|nr:MAG: hypothetical protein A2478_00955 [Candidatus Falkowbacteria bacterium RIFOXYC2_FULL_36_12]OGF34421.1 MAG: hypothetical protein A2223_02755 [Candidatus Falkowbacteria bacterium RIFOXYA2_FULL_35_8]